ncbi:MAG: hypothetical protein K0R84_2530 [Clostridia bacterium]|jgi:outer membrane protein TolC|nr:hypothetical protein [Clostridia bacterium]
MKKILSILAALAIMFNISVAYADTVDIKVNNTRYLSLEEAVKSIESNNPDIKLIDRKIIIVERQYRDALARADYATGKTSTVQSINTSYRKDELLNWKKSLYTLNNLKHDRQDNLRSLASSVTKQYLDALLTQEDIKNIQYEIDNLDKSIKQLEARVSLGTAKESDVKSLEAQKIQLVSQLNSTRRQLNLDLLQLKRDLGILATTNIYLMPVERELKLFNDKDIDIRIAKALENNYEIEKKRQELELTKLEYNIIMNNAIVNLPPEANSLETSIKDKEAALGEELLSQEASLWSTYYNLKNLEDNIEIEKLNVETSQINFDMVSAKVEIGMLTELDLAKARLDLSKQKINLERAINEYMLAADNFTIQLGE